MTKTKLKIKSPYTKISEDYDVDKGKGVILKECREEKGLSLETVHDATKIPMDALRAIEEGYTVRTLSPFYYKGFLKIYAVYLELDPADFVDERKEQIQPSIQYEVDDFQLQNFFSNILTRKRKQQIVILVGIIIALVVIFNVVSFFANRKSSDRVEKPRIAKVKKEIKPSLEKTKVEAPKVNKPVVKTVESRPKVQKAVVPPKKIDAQPNKPEVKNPQVKAPVPVEKKVTSVGAAPIVPTVAKPPAVQQVLKDVTLTVRAKKDCWLRVLVDGNTVYQSALARGTVETWMADERIEISGRNINQLEFELNGKMIGTLGRGDRKAKKVVLTKEGLTVSK